MHTKSAIGVFDSGLGGLTVAHTIHSIMPSEDIIYFGDSKYSPYGTKTKEEVTKRCVEICDHFMELGVKAIVIACNTATSACVPMLREKYPIPIIGMEPALKVACEKGKQQHVAVWATELTLKEKKFKDLMSHFDQEHTIYRVPCPKLVQLVEQDQLNDVKSVDETLSEYIAQASQVDSIVLGCTHFVYYKDRLRQLLPANVALIDGNMGTTLHLQDVLRQNDGLRTNHQGMIQFENSDASRIPYEKQLFKSLEEVK